MLKYSEILKSNNLNFVQRGIWLSVGMPDKEYGWKIHLSTIQTESIQLLERTIPILKKHKVPFKIAKTSDILGELNEGAYGVNQIGKFATIYPSTDNSALEIAKELIKTTKSLRGPKIVTDLHLGGAVYTRYGTLNPKMSRDRLGNVLFTNVNSDAEYKVPYKVPETLINPFESLISKRDSLNNKSNNKLIGPGYLIVETLNVRPKGTIYKALDLRRQDSIQLKIVKEAKQYCVSDNYGRDIIDRLIHQKKLREKLPSIIPIPETDEIFKHNENFYLPISYIDGIDFENRPSIPFDSLSTQEKIKCLKELNQLVEIVKILHNHGIVHRDISPRNVRISKEGKIFLLDLELSIDINDTGTVPFTQGTPGFISPQQKRNEIPNFSDDVYSLGALFLMVLTGLDSRKVIYSRTTNFSNRIQILSGAPSSICHLIDDCLNEDATLRPTINEIGSILQDFENFNLNDQQSFIGKHNPIRKLNDSYVINGIQWILNNEGKDPNNNIWFSPEIESSKHDNLFNLAPKLSLYRSTSRGVSGIVYLLSKLHQIGYYNDKIPVQINFAVDWLLNHEPTTDDQMPGLHFGEAGVAVSITEAVNAKLIDSGDWLKRYLKEALNGSLDWPDITHGAAGQGLASMICARNLSNTDLLFSAKSCADYLIYNQAIDGSWVLPKGVTSLEGITYTGFAHGVAGIVYFLSKYSLLSGSNEAKEAAIKGGNWLMYQSKHSERNNVIWWSMQTGSNQSWRWWCHGGPGIALSFMSLYELTQDTKYKKTVEAALNIHPFAIRYNNLSQCHGLSGLGEIYLEAFRILGNEEWYERAEEIGIILQAMARVDSNGASWLVENPFQATADLMIGCGGIVHFLARINSLKEFDIGMPLM